MIKQIFSTDGKLYALLSTMVQILELNVLMVLFSLPLVTIGASISAAYSVCRRMIVKYGGNSSVNSEEDSQNRPDYGRCF